MILFSIVAKKKKKKKVVDMFVEFIFCCLKHMIKLNIAE